MQSHASWLEPDDSGGLVQPAHTPYGIAMLCSALCGLRLSACRPPRTEPVGYTGAKQQTALFSGTPH